MTASRLGRLQTEVLHAFFRREKRFFLTGGAALVGFYLRHRDTEDLGFFATSNILDDADHALRDVAVELGASIERPKTYQTFRRRIVRRGDEAVIVDLVFDQAPQVIVDKPTIDGIRIDPPEEILANKLCTVLSRSEARDLVDVMCLERSGLRVEDAIPSAALKDGGVTPGQLAWVLSQITIGDQARLPGGVAPAEMRAYLIDLQERLGRMAFPA